MASDEAMSGEVLTATSGEVLTALASRSPATRSLPNVASPVAMSDRAAKALSSNTFHVDRLLSGDVLNAAREAAASLAHEHGQAAAVGDDDESKVDTSVCDGGDSLMVSRDDCAALGPKIFDRFGVFAVRDAVPSSTLLELQRTAKANFDQVLQYRSMHYAGGCTSYSIT